MLEFDDIEFIDIEYRDLLLNMMHMHDVLGVDSWGISLSFCE